MFEDEIHIFKPLCTNYFVVATAHPNDAFCTEMTLN